MVSVSGDQQTLKYDGHDGENVNEPPSDYINFLSGEQADADRTRKFLHTIDRERFEINEWDSGQKSECP